MSTPRVFKMSFAKIYPLYVQKAEQKGRTEAEVETIITWLTGYDHDALHHQLDQQVDCATFMTAAPDFNAKANQITGVVCGVRVEDVADPTMQRLRYLDKLIDELAKGKPLEKILRS